MSTITLQVSAGSHHREFCPVSVRFLADTPLLKDAEAGGLELADTSGNPVACQWEALGEEVALHWIVDRLDAGESRNYILQRREEGTTPGSASASSAQGIRLIEKEHAVDIVIEGQLFTSYVFDPAVAKPYLGPIMGPYGESYTRLDFETREHPHHRSLWLAIGDVNDIDMWNEPKERHGKQIVTGFGEKAAGSVFARLTSTQNWCSYGGKPQLSETRTMTFYNTPGEGRFIDLDFVLTANGRVELGATKEAGPLGIRVAESMKAENGGVIRNSYGSVGEKECWGQRAVWCDYHGEVGGHTLGIAAFDHPDNADFPTYWHVRDYGLLAANNLYFLGGKLLQKGQSIRYKHRIYFHAGDTAASKVADKYQDYIHPPAVTWAEDGLRITQ
ncbi:PmoA family protein [Paenibacillus doosanensis]|uniref:DUF6807 domain-containing protein n=1 Tax=Paenibacillus doosanensis TaxID=1229154 RepID=UPI0021805D05|nr:PmoA family protein [Paenibacillus doosanensis]MCS7462626.1 PmoA family protein [Paenibacillus doosanensis]